ncbi:MAG: hypothetical protein NVSMB52_15970 [Chloroflexota bacterium]
MRAIHGEKAQGMLEMALVLPILLLIICGILDFGFAFAAKLAVTNSARNGARYASTHPTSWTAADPAGQTTIEGQIQNSGGTASIPNDDSHILISYLTSSATACGHYSTAGFVGSQSTCVVAGNLIQVQVTYHYSLITPVIRQLFSSGISLTSTATMVEEQ